MLGGSTPSVENGACHAVIEEEELNMIYSQLLNLLIQLVVLWRGADVPHPCFNIFGLPISPNMELSSSWKSEICQNIWELNSERPHIVFIMETRVFPDQADPVSWIL